MKFTKTWKLILFYIRLPIWKKIYPDRTFPNIIAWNSSIKATENESIDGFYVFRTVRESYRMPFFNYTYNSHDTFDWLRTEHERSNRKSLMSGLFEKLLDNCRCVCVSECLCVGVYVWIRGQTDRPRVFDIASIRRNCQSLWKWHADKKERVEQEDLTDLFRIWEFSWSANFY